MFFTTISTWWMWLLGSISFRTAFFFAEKKYREIQINKWFEQHAYEFKQQYGPYGIRLINKAASDPSVKRSLAEVFTPDIKKLQETVKDLEMMDTLFSSGLRPDGDTYQLHDLKLKYGKYRLEKKN